MDRTELIELLNPESLSLLDSLPQFETNSDVLKTVSKLRVAGHSPARVAAVLNQAKLRRKAQIKFGEFANQMLFTEAGLEQATRLQVSALHAQRFLDSGSPSVADLGCGIGGDAIAFAGLGLDVLAVDQDEVTAAIASYNLTPWPAAQVQQAKAEEVQLGKNQAVWLDPARRTNSKRLSDPKQWSPGLDFVFELAREHPLGVKLAPGMDRGLIPERAEAQWISVDGSVVELVLWFGALARTSIRRSALVITSGRKFEMVAETDSPDAEAGELDEFLYEPDGSVIRARLIGDLARSLDGRMIGKEIAWITSSNQVDTPFAPRFRVLDCLPIDIPKLRKRLSELEVGTVEIKTRGVDVDPASLRPQLKLRGKSEASLILTRLGRKRVAIIAKRESR